MSVLDHLPPMPFLNPCKCGGTPIVDYYYDCVIIKCSKCGKKCGCSIDANHPSEWTLRANLAYSNGVLFWNEGQKGEQT